MTSITIRLRRGTAAQWASANPVLGAGEAGFETDTNVLKVGDGVTAYNSLASIGGSGGANLTWDAATRTVASDSGTDAVITIADGTNAGLMSSSDFTKLSAISGTNTGDQTSIVGITGTKAQFDTAVTDGNFLYVGDAGLTDLADVTITSAAEGQSLIRGASEFVNQTMIAVTLGPFYINDMAGTATTDATLGYFNTATAVSRSANEVKMQTAGRVVGVIITSDATRTAGTATVAVEVNNGTQAFDGGAVALDATNTTSDSSFVAWGSGVSFNAGDTIGAEVTTSGWTPITANFSIWLVVMLKF